MTIPEEGLASRRDHRRLQIGISDRVGFQNGPDGACAR
jgi:hypothetical protein